MFDDVRLYEILFLPLKFEKLVITQCMLYTSSLIANLVVMPIRVIWTILRLLVMSTVGRLFTNKRKSMSVRDQADFIRVLVGALVTYYLL